MWLGVGRRPVRTVCMTWKRVATALVLIPVVVGLVLFASTAAVSVATAVITVLALWEYFALGEAIGHRAYRVWSTVGALLMLFAQTRAAMTHSYFDFFSGFGSPLLLALFVFIFGIAALTLWTKRPLVEALPAAGISCSGLLMVAFPLSFAVRLHAFESGGPKLLLFALVITWAGDTAAYFVV